MTMISALWRRLPGVAAMAALTSAVLAGPTPTQAGAFSGCQAPFVFDGGAANIVPIQYDAAVEDSDDDFRRRLTDTAQRLAWLTKMDSWHQPTYGSLGVVAHMGFGELCDPDETLAALLEMRRGARRPFRPGQAALVLHGRLYQEGNELYVQSTLRAFRVNRRDPRTVEHIEDRFAVEALSLALPGGAEPMRAVLPLGRIVFPPRRLELADLDWIQQRATDASRIYESPSLNAGKSEIRFNPDNPRAFSIAFHDSDWLYVEDFESGEGGYIRRDPTASARLHEKMPELDFLNGTLGFLRFQQAAQQDAPPPPAGALDQVRAAFYRYSAHESARQTVATRALAEALVGVLEAQTAASWAAARAHFAAAVERAPYDGTFRNLLAMAQTQLCCVSDAGTRAGVDPVANLVDALSLDPQDRVALANLDAYFSYLERLDEDGKLPQGVDAGDLGRRHERVRKVRAALGP